MLRLADTQTELRKEFVRACKAFKQAANPLKEGSPPDPRDLSRTDWQRFVDLRCGAKSKRSGRPCRLKALYACGRCKFHGGLSTGPKTLEGKARSAANGRLRLSGGGSLFSTTSNKAPLEPCFQIVHQLIPQIWANHRTSG